MAEAEARPHLLLEVGINRHGKGEQHLLVTSATADRRRDRFTGREAAIAVEVDKAIEHRVKPSRIDYRCGDNGTLAGDKDRQIDAILVVAVCIIAISKCGRLTISLDILGCA